MNKELLPFESESLSRRELDELIADTKNKISMRKKRRHVLPIAAAVAAIVAVSSVTVYAKVFKGVVHKESVNNYYNSELANEVASYDISELIEEQVSENEHFRVTIESVLTDDITMNMIATFEALDDAGKACLNDVYAFVPGAYVCDADGNYMFDISSYHYYGDGIVETDTRKSTMIFCQKDDLGEAEEINIRLYNRLYFEMPGDPEDTVYTGLEFKVKTKPNVKTYTFVADNGYEAQMSSFQVYFDLNMPSASEDVSNVDFVVNYSDGSKVPCFITDSGHWKFDVEQIESIEYKGYTFYPKK